MSVLNIAYPVFRRARLSSSVPYLRAPHSASINEDLRGRLLVQLKAAMKNKDTLASTTLRSVLADVNAADKASPEGKATPRAVVAVFRKAAQRRIDSAAQYLQASRPDLAEKEQQEADVLSPFIPPLLPEAEIERILHEIIAERSPQQGNRKGLGILFKDFYSKVDKSAVDSDLVKKKAEELLLL